MGKTRFPVLVGALASALSLVDPAQAAGIPATGLDEVVVTAERGTLLGAALSASEGTVLSDELENRPLLRSGEVLEIVPGLVVTQHSGAGKANQYFLRGFNLDHGTDFATRVDGLPVNMPSHAHGQGYSDLSFLIPELVNRVEYRKGTYYADEGDFSAAGAADIRYQRRLASPVLLLTGGQDAYHRAILAASLEVAGGDLLLAAQYAGENGPWVLPEADQQIVGVLKFTRGGIDRGLGFEAMGYDGHWRSTDQVPLRAIAEGLISRFGAIDPSDGGRSHRYSISGDLWQQVHSGHARASAYAIDYQLALYSNFTYYTDAVRGDQFEQFDHRHIVGGTVSYDQPLRLLGDQGTFKAGLQLRDDRIAPDGLYATVARVPYKTLSESSVHETSYSAFLSQELTLRPRWRVEGGVRFDAFRFGVDSNLAANSGSTGASIASPKLTMVFGPWQETEFFFNYGKGFHSNDARGTTMIVNPDDGVTPVARVSPLVRAVGGELGARTAFLPNLQLAISIWTLRLDSELTLNTDASQIVPSGATHRTGVELGAYYRPIDSVLIDADLAWTHARYADPNSAGQYIPNALEQVASAGIGVNRPTGWFGGARLRYFGAAPVSQDDRVRSRPALQVYLDGGYHFSPALSGVVSVFNVLNRRDCDIEYYYASQLRAEPAPVNDLHVHPVEPRSVRATILYRF